MARPRCTATPILRGAAECVQRDQVADRSGHQDLAESDLGDGLGQGGQALADGGALVDDDAVLALDPAQASRPDGRLERLVAHPELALDGGGLELREHGVGLHVPRNLAGGSTGGYGDAATSQRGRDPAMGTVTTNSAPPRSPRSMRTRPR